MSQLGRGTANTVLFGERPQVCKTAAGDLVYNLWGLGIYNPHMPAFATLTPSEPAGLLSTGQFAPVSPLPGEGAANRDAQIRVKIGRQEAMPEQPDFESLIQIIRSYRPCDPRLPGGPHPEGMQVVMADGSVRIFGPETSPWVFWNACVAADNK
jgi:prepilin-type processing-associated H-X9-DG protein